MSKRKSSISQKVVNLILLIASLVTAGLALLGLFLPMITSQAEFLSYTKSENWNLGQWFENINDMDGFDKIGNWQFARVALIVSMVLLILMAILLVLKVLIKHPSIKWTTIGVGMAMVASSIVFMVVTIAGCVVMSGELAGTMTGITYIPNAGVFVFSILAVISAMLTEVTVIRK